MSLCIKCANVMPSSAFIIRGMCGDNMMVWGSITLHTRSSVQLLSCVQLCDASLVAQLVKNPPAMQETWVRSLDWEDPLGEGKGYPTQYSGLENSMDCIVHQVAKSQTQLSIE